MTSYDKLQLLETRRQFFGRCACGIGGMALASLLNPIARAAGSLLMPRETRPRRIVVEPRVCPRCTEEDMAQRQGKMQRRSFIGGVVAALVAVLAGARTAIAAGGDMDFSLSSATTGKCGTCGFWGGVRKVAADGKTATTHTEATQRHRVDGKRIDEQTSHVASFVLSNGRPVVTAIEVTVKSMTVDGQKVF